MTSTKILLLAAKYTACVAVHLQSCLNPRYPWYPLYPRSELGILYIIASQSGVTLPPLNNFAPLCGAYTYTPNHHLSDSHPPLRWSGHYFQVTPSELTQNKVQPFKKRFTTGLLKEIV